MSIKTKRYIKRIKRRMEAKNSWIWMEKEKSQSMYMILWYNGVKIAEVTEDDNTVTIVFFCTRRQSKRIKKDMRGFEVVYKAARWAC